jgi:ribonuclease P protein component
MRHGARKEGLSRRHRFSGPGAYSPALRSPSKVRGRLATLHVTPGVAGCSRFGVAIAKRIAPKSVDRNRLKRLARESFRRHAAKAAGLDLVLMPRGALAELDAGAWIREVEVLLGRALKGS